MNLKKNFINDPENFEKSMEKILAAGIPDKFDKHFLIDNGFKDSVAVLYVNLFTSLELIDEEGEITDDYERLVTSDSEARMVIAEKVWQQYSDLFAEDKQIYEKPKDKITEIFKRVYGDDHSETYLKLLASTFKTLVNYANLQSGKKIAVLEEAVSEGYLNGASDHVVHDDLDSEALIQEESNYDNDNNDSDTDGYFDNDSYTDEDLQESDTLINKLIETETDLNPETEPESEKMMTEETNIAENLTDESGPNHTNSDTSDKEIINQQLSLILSKKVDLLQKLNRPKEAVEAIDMLIDFYDKSDRADRTEVLSKTLIRKSELLEELGLEEEALSACDEFINRFFDSKS
jgi:hypothetical protein